MFHACGVLLWWNMYFMDRVHLGSWYVSLSLGISLWSHHICYGEYDDGYLGIDLVWFLYMGLSCDGHASHGLGSILLSWKCMNFIHVIMLIPWHTWWRYWHRCWCTIYDGHDIDLVICLYRSWWLSGHIVWWS